MEIVKKNILSIICGVIALLAVVALFWPIGGMYGDLQTTLVARKKLFDDLSNMHKARRSWPVMPDVGNTVQASLTQFPSAGHIEAGKAIEEKVKKQANRMKELTAENNVHLPLMPDVLPVPGEQRFRFATAYAEAMTSMAYDLAWVKDATVDWKTNKLFPLPPSDQEVIEKANEIWISSYDPKIIKVAGNEVNRPQVEHDWQDEVSKLQLKMRNERAMKLKMYIDNNAITVSHALVPAPPLGPKETEIWYAQNSLWVEQDLAAALNSINTNADGSQTIVTESPVKHLIAMRLAEDQAQYFTGGGTTAGQSPSPTDGFSKSITGRVSNSLYDVIKFDLVMNVDASKIPLIISKLQKGRLITIDHVNAASVDGISAADAGFIYGNVPVVKLTIQGEDLFLRDWTVKLMPGTIKSALNITETK